MMACKKALEETNGDFDKAVETLRKKGQAKAADRAERTTANGLVLIKAEGGKAAMLNLQCETDFVARGDDFVSLGEAVVNKLFAGEISVDDSEIADVKDAVLKMGENLQVKEMAVLEGAVIGSYVHSNSQIGTVVVLDGGDEGLAKNVAMHAAATNPSVLSPDEVSDELVVKEKEIWTEQLKGEGKPEEIMEKIMMGKERKFREENALLKQTFVKDPEKTIEQLLGDVKIKDYKRFAI